MNQLWAALIAVSALAGLLRVVTTGSGEPINAMADALFDSAKSGFELSFGLVAALALWLGLFRVAEAAGLVRALARALSPLLTRLLPDLPRDHPALASIGLNVGMSMLGIDNGALPSGLKAMEEMEQLNATPGVASRAQQMFLVYMTTSVTLFPVSILGYRIQTGSAHPADVFVPLLLASYMGLFAGLAYMAVVQRLRVWDPVLLAAAMALIATLGGVTWAVGRLPAAEVAPRVALWGNAALLGAVLVFVLVAWARKVAVFEEFLVGAKEGFQMAVGLIPYVIGMLVAIGLLRASGAFPLLQQGIEALGQSVGIDTRWVIGLPQGIMKSFSGGGARAFMLDAFKTQGPDSFAGHLSAIIQGASDTTFYILAACAGAAKLKHLGHAVTGALVADVVSFVAAVLLTYAFFGG